MKSVYMHVLEDNHFPLGSFGTSINSTVHFGILLMVDGDETVLLKHTT